MSTRSIWALPLPMNTHNICPSALLMGTQNKCALTLLMSTRNICASALLMTTHNICTLALLMSTHNICASGLLMSIYNMICFQEEIRKISVVFTWNKSLISCCFIKFLYFIDHKFYLNEHKWTEFHFLYNLIVEIKSEKNTKQNFPISRLSKFFSVISHKRHKWLIISYNWSSVASLQCRANGSSGSILFAILLLISH